MVPVVRSMRLSSSSVEWVIPRGRSISISIAGMHANADVFPEPGRFDPQRFIGSKPPTFAWIPFGGGARRCVGAVFANMEMDVVLRTVLRYFTIETTTAPGEKWHPRGIAFTPKDGGKIVVHRRDRCS
jgi:cytochrome P450 family 138